MRVQLLSCDREHREGLFAAHDLKNMQTSRSPSVGYVALPAHLVKAKWAVIVPLASSFFCTVSSSSSLGRAVVRPSLPDSKVGPDQLLQLLQPLLIRRRGACDHCNTAPATTQYRIAPRAYE